MKKTIIKITAITLLGLMSIQANAQSFGIRAGFNMANMLNKDDNHTYSDDNKSLPGFHVGLTYELPLVEDLISFEPGVMFTTKGSKYSATNSGISVESKTNLSYVDIPLLFKFHHEFDQLRVFGAVGPYVGFGFSGKTKTTITYGGNETNDTESVKWGSDKQNDDLKPFDMGLTFGAGIEVKSIMFGVFYDLGLANISPYQDNGTTIKNRVFRISLGYQFGR